MKLFILIPLLIFGFCANAQSLTFRQTDQKVRVFKGSTIEISADTAFIISNNRAQILNEKLTELELARELNKEVLEEHQELKSKVLEIEELVSSLLQKIHLKNDEIALNLTEILTQLDTSLVTLRQNNNELAQHNRDLKAQLAIMQSTIKTLKKEIRGIWWNGLLDKVVVGVICLTVGFIAGSI